MGHRVEAPCFTAQAASDPPVPTLQPQARFLLTSTSEVYGDPLVHPQTEDYWGNVNCIGERSCYDEGKRAAECLTFDYLREHNLEVGCELPREPSTVPKHCSVACSLVTAAGGRQQCVRRLFQVRVVRIFNTYGPHMALDDGRVVSNFVAQALTGQPLTVFGDGSQTRSFQFISDLVEGAKTGKSAV